MVFLGASSSIDGIPHMSIDAPEHYLFLTVTVYSLRRSLVLFVAVTVILKVVVVPSESNACLVYIYSIGIFVRVIDLALINVVLSLIATAWLFLDLPL